MYAGWVMPVWYKNWRYPIMMVQILIAVLIQAHGLAPRKGGRKKRALAFFFCAAVCFFIVSLEYHDGKFYCHYLFIEFTMFFLAFLTTFAIYQVTVCSAILVAANSYLMQEMGGALKTILRLAFPALVDLAYDPVGILIMDALSYGIGYLVLYLFLHDQIRQTDYLQERNKVIVAVLDLLICIGMSSVTRGHDILTSNISPGIVDNIYLIGSGALLLALQIGLAKQFKALQDVNTMKEIVHAQSLQYKASKETVTLLNEKYHDIKKIIGALRVKVTDEELEQLDKSVSVYGAYLHTGSEVLDVLITEKRILCEKNSIHITTMLDGTDLSFVEPLDLYALFNNALTNAIDAVKCLPEGAERFIAVSISRSGQMIIIHMENPCSDNLIFKDGLPVTAVNAEDNSLGMKSMERIAEKYDGTLTATQNDGVFVLDILLIDPN